MLLFGGILPFLQVLLPLCNAASLLRGHVWALPLSVCWRPVSFGPSVLFLFLELYMALILISPRERSLGSTAFLCWLAVSSTVMSIAYVGWMLVLGGIFSAQYWVEPIQGIWPIVMLCITLRSIGKPEETTSFWGVLQMPNRWYPVFLAAVFSLLNGRLMWDFVAAILFAHAHERYKLEGLVVGRHWVEAVDRRASCFGGRLLKFVGGDWVPIGGSPPTEELEAGGGTVMRPGTRAGQGQSAATPSFHAFSGAGQRLGSA